MSVPFGIGDTIAIIKVCVDLADLIQDARTAPSEYQDSVHTLKALHGTYLCLSTALRDDTIDLGYRTSQRALSLHDRIASEVQRTNSALLCCRNILMQYARPSLRFPLWHKAYTQIHWRGARQKFEKQLTAVHRSLHCIQTLLSLIQRSDIVALREGIAAIQLDLNKRPQPMGLPGSGGIPADHIGFSDGLGRLTYLPNDLCSGPVKLHGYLKLKYTDDPGERRVQHGHYKLYHIGSGSPKELTAQDWSRYVKPGTSIWLAFVIGTWQMGCLNWCPGCYQENQGPWRAWRECSCGVQYYVTEAGKREIDYEPIDGMWCGETTKSLAQWKKPVQSALSPDVPASTYGDEVIADADEHKVLDGEERDLGQASGTKDYDESYFQRMVMIYDPIFNLVCRNVFCRCILGATSPSSDAPRIDFVTAIPCPMHAKAGVRPSRNAARPSDDGYHADPYFDKYGGYERFLQLARYLSQTTIACAFVDVDRFCPENQADEAILADLSNPHWRQYRADVFPKLEQAWKNKLRQQSEDVDPEFASLVEDWMVEEARDLADIFESHQEEKSKCLDVSMKPEMIPVLWNGRMILEDVEHVARNRKDYEVVL